MINVVIPLTEKPAIKNLAEEVRKVLPGAFVVVGITENFASDVVSDVVNVFPCAAKKEEMINSLVHEVREGPIIFLRDLRKLSRISELIVPGKDVVMFCKKKGEFGLYLEDAKDWLVGVFFGFKTYRGDAGAVYIGEKFAEVTKHVPSVAVSMASRVNRFAGAEIHYVEEDKKTFLTYKPKVELFKLLNPLIIIGLLIVGLSVTLGVFSSFFAENVWLGITVSFVLLLLASFVCYFLLKLFLVLSIGELIVKEVDKINQIKPKETKQAEKTKKTKPKTKQITKKGKKK